VNPGTRNYAIVTAAYWGFTLTDGALRMLVLLHFFRLGYSPFTLALLFLLYEAAGIGANLAGGWLATRFGIARMLAVGLFTQILGFLLLSAMSPDWRPALSIAWVVVAQGVCGVAKDLTKTASKSAIKLTAGNASGRLFRWVAFFTGSKNAMKGLGFFLGGLLLELLGFRGALWAMAAGLALVLAAVTLSLPPLMGKAKPSASVRDFFAKHRGVNLLAAARVFLFGARDVWFVVGLPVFLYAAGWSFTMVGGFLALWTIGYGLVQAAAPALVSRSADGLSAEVPAARLWSLVLAVLPALLAVALLAGFPRGDLVVVLGLAVFGFAFAVNTNSHGSEPMRPVA
jgi:MFS family permease